MSIRMDAVFIYEPSPPRSLRHFIDFWCQRYRYPYEDLYTKNIGGLNSLDELKALFRWKIGNKLFENKLPLLAKSFFERRHEAKIIMTRSTKSDRAETEVARRFLSEFGDGGAIWRIFWLHCWNQQFPIYDQHVHRAMTYIQDEKRIQELGKLSHAKKIDLYLERYLPFWEEFAEFNAVKVDRALWRFGKSLKDGSLPPRRAASE